MEEEAKTDTVKPEKAKSPRPDKDKRLNQLCAVIEYFRIANPTPTDAKLFFGNKKADNYIPSRTFDNHLYFLRRLNEKFGNPLPVIMPTKETNPHKFSSYQFRNSDNEDYFLLLALLAKLGQSILNNDGSHPAFMDIRKMLSDAPDQGENKSIKYSHLDLLEKIHYKSSEIDAEPTISFEKKQFSIVDNIMRICSSLLGTSKLCVEKI